MSIRNLNFARAVKKIINQSPKHINIRMTNKLHIYNDNKNKL